MKPRPFAWDWDVLDQPPSRRIVRDAYRPHRHVSRLLIGAGIALLGAMAIWAVSNVPAAAETGHDDPLAKNTASSMSNGLSDPQGIVGGAVGGSGPANDNETFARRVRESLIQNPEIILEVFALLEAQQAEKEAASDLDLVASVSEDLFAGLDRDKPILVEFQDYNCGYCRRAHATVAAVKAANPDLQLVMMELPILGEGSRDAALTALAVRQAHGEQAYLRFADALMTLEGPANQISANRLVAELDFDADAVAIKRAVGEGTAELRRVQQLANRIGASGTPYFVGPSGIARGAASMDRLAEIAEPRPVAKIAEGKTPSDPKQQP